LREGIHLWIREVSIFRLPNILLWRNTTVLGYRRLVAGWEKSGFRRLGWPNTVVGPCLPYAVCRISRLQLHPVKHLAWYRTENWVVMPEREAQSISGTPGVADPPGSRDGFGGHGNALAWSPDSLRLAAALDNGTVRLWRLEGRYSCRGKKPDGPHKTGQQRGLVTRCRMIATGSEDGTVRVWDANNRALWRQLPVPQR